MGSLPFYEENGLTERPPNIFGLFFRNQRQKLNIYSKNCAFLKKPDLYTLKECCVTTIKKELKFAN